MSIRRFAKALVVSLFWLFAVGFLVAGCSGVSAEQAASVVRAVSESDDVGAAAEPAVNPAIESALSVTAGWVERRLELSVAGADLEMIVRLSWDAEQAERAQLYQADGPGLFGDELEKVRAAMEAEAVGRNGPIDRDTLHSERAMISKVLVQLFATTDALSEIVEGRMVAVELEANAGSGSAGEYWRFGSGDPPW